MTFDAPAALNSHQLKFCLNSKYADLDSLDQQYATLQPHQSPKRIPASSSMAKSSFDPSVSRAQPKNIDREYYELLRQIGDREDLRKKLERQKMSAEEELASLEKKENEVFVNARRQELADLIKKREEMAKQEETIQKQIKNFEKEIKYEDQSKKINSQQDYVYREGREAGKLAMQRRLLQQKKRQIENNLKLKRRQEQKKHEQINKIIDQPIYIPDFRRSERTKDKPRTEPAEYLTSQQSAQNPYKPQIQQQNSVRQTAIKQPLQKTVNKHSDAVKVSAVSKGSRGTTEQQVLLKAHLFAGEEKTLFESLNPKGKSDEDIFIETLVAQEYDALNVLARLPKDSQLYAAKMKQFQEMSKIRQDLKDKVQKVRLEKVRRQFEMQKNLTQTQKNNLQWLDQNRRQMLNRQVDILRNNNARQHLENSNSPINGTALPNYTPTMNKYQTSNQHRDGREGVPSIDNIPSPLSEGPQGKRGYRVLLKSVKNYAGASPMCIRLSVLQQGEQDAKWNFSSKYHQETAPRDERNPYNPGVRNRLDQSGAIIFNQPFDIQQDLQGRYNRSQAELYLWIMMMEKDDLKLSNQPELTLWYCFKLTHFGNLRQGTFTLSLFRDACPYPNAPDMNRMKGRSPEEVTIQLSQQLLDKSNNLDKTNIRRTINQTNTRDDPDKSSVTSIGRRAARTAGRQGRSMKPKPSDKKIDSLRNINEDFFIQNYDVTDFEPTKSEDPISFDFRIRGLRTLPSYVGPLKLQLQWIDHEGNEVTQRDEILSELQNDMYNPKVKYHKKINKVEVPGSTVLIIRIIGLSTLDYSPGILGFTYFHIGYDDQGNFLQRDIPQYFMINGHFQLPIYWGQFQGYLTSQELQSRYPTIPCTSILLSIGDSAKQGSPDYNTGIYNTIFFSVNELEYRLFQEQSKRQRLKTMDYVLGYYKFKGINVSDYSQDELKKLLGQALAFNQQNTSHLLRLEALAQYSSSFGVQVAVDGALLPQSTGNYYFFATVCLYPPAKYYSQEGSDLHFAKDVDLASSLTAHLLFRDPQIKFFPKFNSNVFIIVELHRVKLTQELQPASSPETVGYSVVPIFDLSSQIPCVDVGPQQVRLIDGQFGKRQLSNLVGNAVRYMELLEGQKKGQFTLKIRILNGYFNRQWSAEQKGSKGKPLRTVFQNSKGFKNAQKGVLKVIEDTFGVRLS